MKENILAKRYANALFQLAKERRILEPIQSEVDLLVSSVNGSADLQQLLQSQDIKKNEKKNVIEKVLQKRVSQVFLNFVMLLLDKNREALFLTIAREFHSMYERHNKRTRAAAITAEPLDVKSTKALKQFLDKTFDSDVQIENRLDPSILGGLIVNVEGKVFDGSVQSQLRRLRVQLLESSESRTGSHGL